MFQVQSMLEADQLEDSEYARIPVLQCGKDEVFQVQEGKRVRQEVVVGQLHKVQEVSLRRPQRFHPILILTVQQNCSNTIILNFCPVFTFNAWKDPTKGLAHFYF